MLLLAAVAVALPAPEGFGSSACVGVHYVLAHDAVKQSLKS